MTTRFHVFSLSLCASALACGDTAVANGEPRPPSDRAALTVSYRSAIDVPPAGAYLPTADFIEQIAVQDPLMAKRCPVSDAEGFRDLSESLGGLEWTHAVDVLPNEALPPIYDGRIPDEPSWGDGGEAAAKDNARGDGPTIEKPDLVGLRGNIAVFLSRQHGLLTVDLAASDTPTISCALRLPGQPKSFFYRDGEIVLLLNAPFTNNAAVARFGIASGGFSFLDAVALPNETIVDARRFVDDTHDTMLVYTQWFNPPSETEPATEGGAAPPSAGTLPDPYDDDDRFDPYDDRPASIGTKIHALRWTDALTEAWADDYLNEEVVTEPGEGFDPDAFAEGDLVGSNATFESFISASDTYAVLAKRRTDVYHDGFETRYYSVCTDYNPKHHKVTSCHPDYEQRDNPDYVPPSPSGDYDCDGKKLADCIVEAAPKVSQYIYVRVGQTCHTNWEGQCMAYEQRSETYPVFRREDTTELQVYRYVDGDFIRLDGNLYDMGAPTEDVEALAFEPLPFVIEGHIASADQIQFQGGYFYVLASGDLHAMRIDGNSAVRTARVNVLDDDWNSVSALARFAPDRLLISKSDYRTSEIVSVNLEPAYAPAVRNRYSMPGNNAQLILSDHGFLGPGNVSFQHGGVARTLEKLTLYAKEDGAELDNLLLGTEFDTLERSWGYFADDPQRIRLHWDSQRLFTPFGGSHHVTGETTDHLSVSRVEAANLVSEGTLTVPESIVRTVNLDSESALAFGDGSLHKLTFDGNLWQFTTWEQVFVPVAAYRFRDDESYARINRFARSCEISTHAGVDGVFDGSDALGSATIACSGRPVAVGLAVVFPGSRTGVMWNDDGTDVRELTPEEVDTQLAAIEHDTYCTTSAEPADPERMPQRIMRMDELPDTLVCLPLPEWMRAPEDAPEAG